LAILFATLPGSSVVEQVTVNHLVVGSIPTRAAIYKSGPISDMSALIVYVYILENAAGRFYVGQSADLASRLADHNSAGSTLGKFTRKNGPWLLVWFEAHTCRSAAMRREREIKSWKSARTVRERLLGR
jgi:putative endonuclease